MAFDPKAPPRRIVAEIWLYPDGSRILELSTKCLPDGDVPGRRGGQGLPARAGASTSSGAQQTKTKTALEFYAGQLHRPEAADRRSLIPRGTGAQGAGKRGGSMRRFIVEALVDAAVLAVIIILL